MRKTERRAVEVRFSTDDEGEFEGYAARFGEADTYGDVINPGAFAKTLEEHRAAGSRPVMLWSHDPAAVIGVWESLQEDDTGLKAHGRLVLATEKGREAHALLKAGALNGLSIGFRARGFKRTRTGRNLSDVELGEISLVALPAAPRARVEAVRSFTPDHLNTFKSACRDAARAFQKRTT